MTRTDFLIADDHEPVRRNLRRIIESRAEWRICGEALDGLDAIDKAHALGPQVILMDLSMPRMSGFEATRKIREQLPSCKIIIVSQNDPELVRQQAAQSGAHGYVIKTKVATELVGEIQRVLGQEPEKSVEMPAPREGWLFGGSTMAPLIRAYDWSQTPLGPLAEWPQSLRTTVNLMLNSQHPIWIGWGPEKTFLYNDAYISVLSLAKHPWALGKPAQVVWAEIWDVCGPLADRVFNKGEASYGDDIRLFMSRGDYLEETYYSFSYSPIYDEAGKVAGLFCPSAETTAQNLHARRLHTLSELSAKSLVAKNIEEACRKSIEIISQNPDDIPFALLYLLDADRKAARLQGASRVAEEIEGVSPRLIDVTHATGLVPWPILELAHGALGRVITVDEIAHLPRGAANQPVHEAMALPVASAGSDQPVGILIAGVNPTRKLDAEYRTFFSLLADQVAAAIQDATALEKERARADALAEVDRAKTAFFSNVSHEFRTPLTLMLGPLEDSLAESESLPAEHRERLEVAHRNSVRLLRLVNTLLDFSRIEAGRIQVSCEETDLAQLTAELASMFRSAIESAGLRLIVNCSPLTTAAYVDREMWEKIVFNLLSNAFKFTFDGEIEVCLREKDGMAELSVRDTGAGIPEQELPHLFERFHRVKGASGRSFDGSGIGLSLVQELAWLHGGTVRAESKLKSGSTFTVSIPLGKEHLPSDRIVASRTKESVRASGEAYVQEALSWLPEARPGAIHLDSLQAQALPAFSRADQTRPHILLADDNADMRAYLERLLANHYDVTAVADGESALRSAREHRPDLIVSDVMMPLLDGVGLLQTIRREEALNGVPVILLSARAGEEARIAGIQSGADDYLVKPFSARELLARVQGHLELARVRKQAEEQLRQQRERFDLVTQASQVGFWFCDLPFDKLVWDARVKEHFWLPTDADITIDLFFSRLHPQDRERTRTAIEHCIAHGEPYDIEYRTVADDGRHKWIRAMGRAFYDAAGVAKSFDGLTLDITHSKETEERERRITAEAVAATAKFRAVFEQTTVFAGIMTRDGMLIEANRLWLDGCGYRAEEVLGKLFWQTAWWHRFPESQEKIRAAMPLAAQGTPYRETLRYGCADGSERIVDFALYPIVDNQGQVLFLHPTGVDVTDLKRAEENYRNLVETLDAEVRDRTLELEKRNADVLRQSEQLRELSSRLLQAQDEERRHIARELHDSAGQTLTLLAMNLSQLAQDVSSTPKLAESAQNSLNLVQQLNQDIRTMSYLLHPPLLDENGLSPSVSWYVQGLVERSGLDIRLDIAENLGRLPRDIELLVFRLIQEGLTNIHRHSGSKIASISVVRDAAGVTVDIHDQGKGIPPDRLAEIQSGGSGVGIRGMRERLRQYRGTLTIESNGSGTRAHVTIPLRNESRPENDDSIEPVQAAV